MGKTAAVSVGDRLTVEAVRLNDDGEGVASIHGFTVFVPGLLPEEQGIVRITSVGKSFGRANLIRCVGESDLRVQAPCPVFDRCGGCQLQHIPYEAQLAHKKQTVENALRRVGRFHGAEVVEVLPVIGMETPWRYRNHVQLPVHFPGNIGNGGNMRDASRGNQDTDDRSVGQDNQEAGAGKSGADVGSAGNRDGSQGFEIGFYAPESHTLVPSKVCLLQPGDMEDTAQAVASLLAKEQGKTAQSIHHLILRRSFHTGELMVVLVADEPMNLSAVAKQILKLDKVVSVVLTVQQRGRGSVWGPKVSILAGKDYLVDSIGELEYVISPRSFFQVNPVQTERLYGQVHKLLSAEKDWRILDLYCGAGTIGLSLARRVGFVTGIESNPDAVADAKQNAKHNHIENAEFLVGKVEDQLERLATQGIRYTAAVLDPPRKGCDRRVLDALLTMAPEKIVYVSCNPSTLARDLRILADHGYAVGSVQPVDMFPQTRHVECVVLMSRVV